MIRKNWIILSALCLITSACDSDEPEKPYTGPWEIYYGESYYGIHNNCDEFNTWFAAHENDFEVAKFTYPNGDWVIISDYITKKDYSVFYSGDIAWIEIVECASEDEVKQMVDRFKAFTIENVIERKYDRFVSSYSRYDKEIE